ncbi:all trans-polyprenyl-diphosphate synthase PDSS1-like [Artemia franciscana]|uniref:Decaprenyl-diphosphate synthase subunit 1 n=1 Tax=Artemia franciscana TaxID=6661 RepID=A0AA88IDG0_ARTSF|nr:hypothetical protein QYM36_002684 [Artemia franciscana]
MNCSIWFNSIKNSEKSIIGSARLFNNSCFSRDLEKLRYSCNDIGVPSCCCKNSKVAIRNLLPVRLNSSYGGTIPVSEPLKNTSVADPYQYVKGDLVDLTVNIHKELQSRNKELTELAKYYFDGKGKAIRPAIALMTAKAINQHLGIINSEVLELQKKVAMAAEMIHTASLVHDDVIDVSEMRRGKPSANGIWGQPKSAVAGDFIISAATRVMAQLNDADVLICISQVVADLVQGEFLQMGTRESESDRFNHYLLKTFKKTATIMANSCKAVSILAGCDSHLQNVAYDYGRYIGLTFQIVDDLLDFISDSSLLGKPGLADLKLGLATAPVLFAAEQYPELNVLIMRRFSQPGDVQTALECVLNSDGLERTKELARQHCQEAQRQARQLNPSEFRNGMEALAQLVLQRLK